MTDTKPEGNLADADGVSEDEEGNPQAEFETLKKGVDDSDADQ